MKTPFETLLRLRSEALSRSRCPYTDEQLSLLVSHAVAESPSAGLATQPPARRSSSWSIVRAACLLAILFSAAYDVTPAPPYDPFCSTGSHVIDDPLSTINYLYSNL